MVQDPSQPPMTTRLRKMVLGAPKDVTDRSIFHAISLIPLLAWVGLGADGLSSSSYGPEEAFRALGQHTFLAVGLALMTMLTVLLISQAYSRIIEQFPHGGGGYVVATKLLGRTAGLISGSALLVDYVLTITTSVAAAGDALFSIWPEAVAFKLTFEVAVIAGLTVLNIRGVKESVTFLAPIFLLFLVSHMVVIGYGVFSHLGALPEVGHAVVTGYQQGHSMLGFGGMALLFLHAYSLGGGTYTGIEAVSNGLQIMREPRVQTAKRTMAYMAVSLAICSSGLLLCYLLWKVVPESNKTLNAVLIESMSQHFPLGHTFAFLTIFSEGALLVVAAQAGFLDGPRVLANMANDSWVPRRFGALSDRLTTSNGIILMGAASLAALLYTHGNVSHLVVMYSINVFLTFFLSMFGMCKYWLTRRERPEWRSRAVLFVSGAVLCGSILVITVLEKFAEGGWITLAVTAVLVLLCMSIRRHYWTVAKQLSRLYSEVDIPKNMVRNATPDELDASKPTAAVLVAAFGGLGIHTVQKILTTFKGHYKNLVFISVGVVDSGGFKGADDIVHLQENTEATLSKFVELAHRLGVPAAYRMSIGTDAVAEAEKICLNVAHEFSEVTFFSGKIIFQKERWYQRLLHNETALSIQKRLQWAGLTMVVLPARVIG
ncbi:MAG: APC family permease [Proteobacteria bacterium]|nr:APC family permease [Pseudomonadota bacterium]